MMPEKTIDYAATVGALSGFVGSITFTDVYQIMSFVVMALSAVHLIMKIRRLNHSKVDD